MLEGASLLFGPQLWAALRGGAWTLTRDPAHSYVEILMHSAMGTLFIGIPGLIQVTQELFHALLHEDTARRTISMSSWPTWNLPIL